MQGKNKSTGWNRGHGRESYPFDAGLNFCLIFTEPLSIVELQADTRCTLHGMVAWYDLKSLLGEERTDYQNAESCDEPGLGHLSSLFEEGIECSIGELQSGRIIAEFRLEFLQENAFNTVLRDISWNGLTKGNLLEKLKRIQADIIAGKIDDTVEVSLAEFTCPKDHINEKRLKYKAAMAAARGVSMHEVPNDQVNRTMAREIVDRREYMHSGSSPKASLRGSSIDAQSKEHIVFERDVVLPEGNRGKNSNN